MTIIQQNMRKMNLYFFQDETVSLEDGLWFYGGLSLLVFFGLLTMTVRIAGWILS